MYTVFVRNWWRQEGGKLVPHPRARRMKLMSGLTYSEAQEVCKKYNHTHRPGKLSRKAEFTATENY